MEEDASTFAALLADVEMAEAENDRLREVLRQGRSRVGEFHAQLMLDNIRLTNERANLAEEVEAQRKQEELLTRRINFCFEDCQRLSSDNDNIVMEAARRDEELKESERLLVQRQSIFKGALRAVRNATDTKKEMMVALFAATEQLLATKEKAIAQHQHIWCLEDRAQAVGKEAEYLAALQQFGPGGRLPPKPSTLASEHSEGTGAGLSCSRLDCHEVRRDITRLRAALQELHLARAAVQNPAAAPRAVERNRSASRIRSANRVRSAGRAGRRSISRQPSKAAMRKPLPASNRL
jgi:hypothetical protein